MEASWQLDTNHYITRQLDTLKCKLSYVTKEEKWCWDCKNYTVMKSNWFGLPDVVKGFLANIKLLCINAFKYQFTRRHTEHLGHTGHLKVWLTMKHLGNVCFSRPGMAVLSFPFVIHLYSEEQHTDLCHDMHLCKIDIDEVDHIFICEYACFHVFVCMCVCVYSLVYLCVCLCVCTCVLMHNMHVRMHTWCLCGI